MKRWLSPLLLFTTAAQAQAWRADLEFGQDGWGLILLVCLALAYVVVRDAYRENKAKGVIYALAVVGYATAAWLVPILRLGMVALTLFFFFVVIWTEFGPRGRRR